MFDGPDYPKSLDESQFELWLEKGRESKFGYHYMILIWDALDHNYKPVYVVERDKINGYEAFGEAIGQESLVAVYDLYSETRIG